MLIYSFLCIFSPVYFHVIPTMKLMDIEGLEYLQPFKLLWLSYQSFGSYTPGEILISSFNKIYQNRLKKMEKRQLLIKTGDHHYQLFDISYMCLQISYVRHIYDQINRERYLKFKLKNTFYI